MASQYAFVTLLTSDSYLQGALALVAALRDLHPSPAVFPEVDFQTVCLVTPETIDISTIKLLRGAFDVVIGVEVITEPDNKNLKLLGRLDLNTVLTKLHVFRLSQYSKIIFLDADVLPIRPLSHLFTLPYEFAAVPDVGWPDIFNSGVLVLTPGQDKFDQLNELLKTKGSWDGGDQGILNEWRGNDWHRLSFTYNTTPTAAYTYAPAYERYGSQISALHFIGPNKPWNSVPFRPPFSSQQQLDLQQASQAYDYESLVDRWFAVYDKHYRSQPLLPAPQFDVQHYTAAWDELTQGKGAELRTSATRALGLEELRKLAIEGLSSVGLSSDKKPGEGQYISMPLDGRTDLMRPAPESPPPESPAKLSQLDLTLTPKPSFPSLPTPAPNDLPPSPHPEPIPLPPSPFPSQTHHLSSPSSPHPQRKQEHIQHHQQPQRHERYEYHHRGEDHGHHEHQDGHEVRGHDHQVHRQDHRYHEHEHHRLDHGHHEHHRQDREHHEHQHHRQHHGHHERQHHRQDHGHHEREHDRQDHGHHEHREHHEHHEPPRPPSPPKVLWNPAIEPPPKTPPPPSTFPTDTYFPNVWDQSPSQHRRHASSSPSEPISFFQPPPTPDIPESLLKQGHYRDVTGDDNVGATAVPDRSKVKSVFPWEEKPRRLPGRKFPEFDAPQASEFILPEPKPMTVKSSSKESSASPQSPPLSRGLPRSLVYANAWDTVPSIQQYASRLVRTPPAPPLAPAFDSDEWRKKTWEETVEASSMDGDDEDNGDEDEEEDDKPNAPRRRWTEDTDDESVSTTQTRSRRGSSVSATYVIKGKKKEYRVRGVQTISPRMRSQGVQVEILVQPVKASHHQDYDSSRKPKGAGAIGRKRSSPPSSASQSSPVDISAGVNTLTTAPLAPIAVQGLPPAISPDSRSPREFKYSNSPGTARPSPEIVTIPSTGPKPVVQPAVSRQASNDGSSLASPLSSVGPISPEGQPITLGPSVRKASRVWDPARGVELFKRGSEEVLARFLRMGSWEEDHAQHA